MLKNNLNPDLLTELAAALQTEEGRAEGKEFIAAMRAEYMPILNFVIDEFGGDVDNLFNIFMEFIAQKTLEQFNRYRELGFTREEAILFVANQKAEILSAINKR